LVGSLDHRLRRAIERILERAVERMREPTRHGLLDSLPFAIELLPLARNFGLHGKAAVRPEFALARETMRVHYNGSESLKRRQCRKQPLLLSRGIASVEHLQAARAKERFDPILQANMIRNRHV